ncbi:hypothetical protein Tco_0002281 [Tanacetum coccineum]
MIDYALWEVIENGATLPKTQVVEGVTTVMPITSAKDKAWRRLEVKARTCGSSLELLDGNKAFTEMLMKLLRSFVTCCESHMMLCGRNKVEKLETMSMMILYYSAQSSTSAYEDLTTIHRDEYGRDGFELAMAMLTMRAKRFLKNTGRKLTVNGNETIGFDKSKVECYNGHKRGHFDREVQVLQEIKKTRTRHLMFKQDQRVSDYDNCKKGLSYENYNAVPPPYIGNFMPPTPDLSFTGLDEFVNEPVVENSKAMSSKEEPKVVRKNDDAPIIEEQVSDIMGENLAKGTIWSLNEDISKDYILKTNYAYPSRDTALSVLPFTKKQEELRNHTPYPEVTMDEPNITMEEYIRLEEEKARRRRKVFN